MNTYTIEYEECGRDCLVPRFGTTSYAAENANDAVRKFTEEFPDADIRELRRVHVHGT